MEVRIKATPDLYVLLCCKCIMYDRVDNVFFLKALFLLAYTRVTHTPTAWCNHLGSLKFLHQHSFDFFNMFGWSFFDFNLWFLSLAGMFMLFLFAVSALQSCIWSGFSASLMVACCSDIPHSVPLFGDFFLLV